MPTTIIPNAPGGRSAFAAIALLPIWLPALHALIGAAERRAMGTDHFRQFGFDHGYAFVYGLPVLIGIMIVFSGRGSFGIRFYVGLLYALLGTLVGSASVMLFEGLH